jgi:hypothetical protein
LVCNTPNFVSVGKALDSAVGDPRAAGLIDLISPDELTSIYVIYATAFGGGFYLDTAVIGA